MGLRNLVMGLGAMVMLVVTNPWLMLQVLAVLMMVVLPAIGLGRRVRRLSRASQDRVADASALAGEVLNAIPVVQSHTAEGREADRFEQRAWLAMSTALRRVRARAVLVGFVITASSAVLLWGLYMGTLAVREGSISAGVLGQTVFYVILLASAFAVLGETYGDMLRAAGATERLMELLHAQSEVTEPMQPVTPAWPTGGAELTLNEVRFHYPSRPDTWAIDGLRGTVPRGKTVAVVGPSGAGKTTLFDLLMRFHDPQQGGIVMDGVALSQWSLRALRDRIALVPQTPVVFTGSVLDNILYGRPDATEAEVHAAARAAHAHDFILALPQGYDTDLGDRGVRLSGGQRQRIAIARAMLKNAPLLLLDEATEGLAPLIVAEIWRVIGEIRSDGIATLIVDRDYRKVLAQSDRAVVLQKGQVVLQGDSALLRASPELAGYLGV